MRCLRIDSHEILAALLEDETLETEIDATRSSEKSSQREIFSKIGTSFKENDSLRRRDDVSGTFFEP